MPPKTRVDLKQKSKKEMKQRQRPPEWKLTKTYDWFILAVDPDTGVQRGTLTDGSAEAVSAEEPLKLFERSQDEDETVPDDHDDHASGFSTAAVAYPDTVCRHAPADEAMSMVDAMSSTVSQRTRANLLYTHGIRETPEGAPPAVIPLPHPLPPPPQPPFTRLLEHNRLHCLVCRTGEGAVYHAGGGRR